MVHPDPVITLKGVSRLIRTRLSNEALQNPGEVVHQVSIPNWLCFIYQYKSIIMLIDK